MLKPALSLLAATLFTFGCHAQVPAPGKPVPAATAWRIETLLRRKADLPPGSQINIGTIQPSSTSGFSKVSISFTNEGRTSRPIDFLLSDDGKTLEQVTVLDMSADPKAYVSAAGRPSRGGPASAPVTIVGFDDLECPYCAKLHASIFPAITERYGDKVHIVYRDFPLDMHPWAMHASVDVNCLADQSIPGYWNAVDEIHGRASHMGEDPADAKAEKTVLRANAQLDALVAAEGVKQHVDASKLDACVKKQDTKAITESVKLATDLNLQSTPILFINGDKIDGAVPIEFIFGTIDKALLAEGVAPPPPYVAPKVALPGVPAPNAIPAAK